jgi:hypothetical protein
MSDPAHSFIRETIEDIGDGTIGSVIYNNEVKIRERLV